MAAHDDDFVTESGRLADLFAMVDCFSVMPHDRHLRGCMICNIWRSLTGGGVVKLSVEDLQALSN
jgi:hypothetical protein